MRRMDSAPIVLLCLLLPLTLLAPISKADECADYGAGFEWMGALYDIGYDYDVAVDGSLVYVAGGGEGLVIVKVTDPRNPVRLSSIGTLGWARDVAVQGNYAYVAAESAGLTVVDITNPAVPTIAGNVDTSGQALGIVLNAPLVYVADRAGGLKIIDISNPTAPVILGSFATAGSAYAVALSGGVAFIVVRTFGFGWIEFVDVSDPSSPSFVNYWGSTTELDAVAIQGSLAYVAAGVSGGLQILDVSDLDAPVVIGSAPTLGDAATDVVVKETRAYVANGGSPSGLQVIDISNPTAPSTLGFVETSSYGSGVAVGGDFAYMVATGDGGLQVIDIVGSGVVPVVGHVDAPSGTDILGIDVVNGLAYVGFGGFFESGILITDPSLADPVLGSIGSSGEAHDVAVIGTRAYVAIGSNSDSGNISGLEIVDVSDPEAPQFIGRIFAFTEGLGIDVVGDYAYLATGMMINDYGTSGLEIINVENPAAPARVARIDLPSEARDVKVVGTYAFVTARQGGLLVVDITVPSAPSLVTQLQTPGDAETIEVSGSYAYVAADYAGLLIIDISNPEAPVIVASADVPVRATGIALDGSFAYISHSDENWALSNVEVVDVSNPLSPSILGSSGTGGRAGRLVVDGDFVYVAARYGGLELMPVHCPAVTGIPDAMAPQAALRLAPATPNPIFSSFSAGLKIEFELGQIANARLEVFDVNGRLVRRLLRETIPAGVHTTTWDMRTTSGTLSPPGVYFYKLDIGGLAATQKVVVTR